MFLAIFRQTPGKLRQIEKIPLFKKRFQEGAYIMVGEIMGLN
jgi:hypothetical protein